jgi:hypothetical protein
MGYLSFSQTVLHYRTPTANILCNVIYMLKLCQKLSFWQFFNACEKKTGLYPETKKFVSDVFLNGRLHN